MAVNDRYKPGMTRREVRCKKCGRLLHSSISREHKMCSQCEKGGFVFVDNFPYHRNNQVTRWMLR